MLRIFALIVGLFNCSLSYADFKPGQGVFNPQTFTLKNGLKVVVIENHKVPVIKQQIWYKNGFIDDPEGKSGIAHFLEHMMFSPDFMASVARVGGRQNAFTGMDFTSYFQIVPIEALPAVMKMEADRCAKISTVQEKIKTERQVIIEERRMRVDNSPADILQEAMLRNFFWNHSYGRPGIGWAHEMEALNREDVEKFHKKWYVPNNAILLLAGDITVKQAKKLAKQYYGKIPSRAIESKREYLSEPDHRGVSQRVILEHAQVDYPALEIMYKAPSYSSQGKEHANPLEVAAFILGKGPTSLFYKKLVTQKRLASFIAMHYDPVARGPGYMAISAQPAPGVSIEDLEKAITDLIEEVSTQGVSATEVVKAKNRLVADNAYAKDSSFAGADELGHVLAVDLDINYVEKWPDHIMAVTPQQVNAAIKLVFDTKEKLTGQLLPMKRKNDKGKN